MLALGAVFHPVFDPLRRSFHVPKKRSDLELIWIEGWSPRNLIHIITNCTGCLHWVEARSAAVCCRDLLFPPFCFSWHADRRGHRGPGPPHNPHVRGLCDSVSRAHFGRVEGLHLAVFLFVGV